MERQVFFKGQDDVLDLRLETGYDVTQDLNSGRYEARFTHVQASAKYDFPQIADLLRIVQDDLSISNLADNGDDRDAFLSSIGSTVSERFAGAPDDMFFTVVVRGCAKDAGRGLLTVRIGFTGAGTEGSLMRGRSISID